MSDFRERGEKNGDPFLMFLLEGTQRGRNRIISSLSFALGYRGAHLKYSSFFSIKNVILFGLNLVFLSIGLTCPMESAKMSKACNSNQKFAY